MNYIRAADEFQRVYRHGRRYDARSITAFVLPNALTHHRLGVTASRKSLGNAVRRNRAKRLLREAYRSSERSLSALDTNYDWVLNAKGRLLLGNAATATEEFENIVESVAGRETVDSRLHMV